jgi:high-affinity Fe2+/Pb2+ permease
MVERALVSELPGDGNNLDTTEERETLIGILIAIVLAVVAYWLCMALGLPAIVALIAAVLVLIAGVPTGGYGFGSRFGRRY